MAGRLQEDPAGFLRVTWTANPRQLEDTRAVFTHMLRCLLRNGWCRILVNQVQMVPFSRQEQEWVSREWLPQAVEGGYRYGAVVVSTDVMVRLATAFVTTQPQSSLLQYRSFDTDAEAEAWLRQQPVAPGRAV